MSLRTAISSVFFLLIALATAWLVKYVDNNEPVILSDNSRYLPDYVMVNFTSTVTDTQGQPLRQIKAQNMQHYPIVDAEVKQPHLVFYVEQQPTWFVQAPEARISADLATVHLLSGSHIERYDKQGMRQISLRSDDLLLHPDKAYAETYSPSFLTTPQGTMQGRGMRIFMNTQRMEFFADVKGQFMP